MDTRAPACAASGRARVAMPRTAAMTKVRSSMLVCCMVCVLFVRRSAADRSSLSLYLCRGAMGVSTRTPRVCAWLQRHLLSIEREPCESQTFPGLGSPDQPKAMVVALLPIDPVVCAPEDPRWQTIPLSQVCEVLRRSHLLTHAARRESPCGVFMAFPQPTLTFRPNLEVNGRLR